MKYLKRYLAISEATEEQKKQKLQSKLEAALRQFGAKHSLTAIEMRKYKFLKLISIYVNTRDDEKSSDPKKLKKIQIELEIFYFLNRVIIRDDLQIYDIYKRAALPALSSQEKKQAQEMIKKSFGKTVNKRSDEIKEEIKLINQVIEEKKLYEWQHRNSRFHQLKEIYNKKREAQALQAISNYLQSPSSQIKDNKIELYKTLANNTGFITEKTKNILSAGKNIGLLPSTSFTNETEKSETKFRIDLSKKIADLSAQIATAQSKTGLMGWFYSFGLNEKKIKHKFLSLSSTYLQESKENKPDIAKKIQEFYNQNIENIVDLVIPNETELLYSRGENLNLLPRLNLPDLEPPDIIVVAPRQAYVILDQKNRKAVPHIKPTARISQQNTSRLSDAASMLIFHQGSASNLPPESKADKAEPSSSTSRP